MTSVRAYLSLRPNGRAVRTGVSPLNLLSRGQANLVFDFVDAVFEIFGRLAGGFGGFELRAGLREAFFERREFRIGSRWLLR